MTGSGGIPYTQFSNVESNELHYPLLYLYRRRGKDAWGHGYHRGGKSIELAFKPHLTGFIFMLLWNHGAEFSNMQGGSGGLGASAVRFKLARGADIDAKFQEGIMPQDVDDFPVEVLAAKSSNLIQPNDMMYYGVPGGAGYGDPIKREPERVQADIRDGILSPAHALKFYGVVMKNDLSEEDANKRHKPGNNLEVDVKATEAERKKIRENRLAYSKYVDDYEAFELPENEERSDAPSREGAKVAEPVKDLFEVGLSLKIVRDADKKHYWACNECGHVYCPSDGEPKLNAKMRIGRLKEFSHPTGEMAGREPPRFLSRQFYCPSCALLFTTELARADDPIVRDVEYDPDWLDGLE
jgi:rubredoxin